MFLMTIRDSLFRFMVLFLFIIAIASLPLLKAQTVEFMPFNQIKAGNKGWGLTVFRGEEPEKFNFEVLGTLDYGITKYIVVALSGGPTDENGIEIIKDGNVFAGMSGSPLYIDGKIIGALSSTGEFLKKAQALVTPIELMINFKTTALDSLVTLLDRSSNTEFSEDGFTMPHNAQGLKAGDSYIFCGVWDDSSDYCAGPGGTVTMIDPQNPKIFYSLGHSGSAQNGIMAVPFWKAEVITMMPSIAFSQKLLKKTGPMLGAVIFNGPFGQIARFNAKAGFFPLTIQVRNNFRGTLIRKYFFAYTPNIGSNISKTLSGMEGLIDNAFDANIKVRMDISGLPQIYFWGTSKELSAIGYIADIFSKNTVAFNFNIEKITAILSARPKYEILELKKASIESIKENNNNLDLKLALSAVNGEFLTNTLAMAVDKKYLGKKLNISSGNEVAYKILSNLGPSEDTVNLLNMVADRDALYLYYLDEGYAKKQQIPGESIVLIDSGASSNGMDVSLSKNDALISEKNKTSGMAPSKEDGGDLTNIWKAQPPKAPIIEILSKISLPDQNHLIRGDKDIVLTPSQPDTKFRPQPKKKRKFWLF